MGRSVSLPRLVAVWLGVTATLGGLAALALPVALPMAPTGSLAPAELGGTAFDRWLVRGCAVAALGGAGWLWCGGTVLLARALAGRDPRTTWLPASVRRGLLAACGLAVLGAGPVAADPGTEPVRPAARTDRASLDTVLDGLPVPERPLGGLSATAWLSSRALGAGERRPAAAPAPAAGTHLVRSGESLWSIAAGVLPSDASDAAVDAHWRRIHDRNRAVLGPDPDLIRPGQRLVLPPPGG